MTDKKQPQEMSADDLDMAVGGAAAEAIELDKGEQKQKMLKVDGEQHRKHQETRRKMD